jgi:hypothetical protein
VSKLLVLLLHTSCVFQGKGTDCSFDVILSSGNLLKPILHICGKLQLCLSSAFNINYLILVGN